MNYLVMRLYGSFASWGDIAIGESRHSHSGPTKSALMGLLASAFGITREDEQAHQAFNDGYRLATAVQAGHLLRDYHTVQVPDNVGKVNYRTRRDEIVRGRDRLGTVLSSREYRTDAYVEVAIAATEAAPYSLAACRQALLKPIFVPYLGRKSCVLGAPMEPQLIDAENFQQAFDQYQPMVSLDERRLIQTQKQFYWEGKREDFANEEHLTNGLVMTLVMHDQLRSRKRWQFSSRSVFYFCPTESR